MANRSTHKLVLASLAALLLLLAVPGWATQVLVYSQGPDYNNLYASQNDTSGFGANFTAYDNFTLGSATTITSVGWVGGYFNPQAAGSITGWTLSFYANNAGQPGGLITSFGISGNGGETSVGFDNLGDPVYAYGAVVNFAASAGTQYWLSVVPDTAFPPQWGWTTSSVGDGVSYQDDPFGNRTQNPSDLAFYLYKTQQTTTPEPGTLMMLGTGIVGIAGALRRKLGA
ncbi:MAG TPA: PEP-CTERM sorting domain-containing protein [Terriglobales bacterium]